MTALQYLACNGKAFERERKTAEGSVLEDFAFRWKRAKDQPFTVKLSETLSPGSRSTRYGILQSLVSILVQEDTAWLSSVNPQSIGSSVTPGRIEVERREIVEVQENESPLFLAVMSNIPEIVHEIFLLCPEAIKQANKDGMNVLQVAIRHGSIETFELIVSSKILPKRLLSSIDGEGNSLLHMVGPSKNGEAREKVQNPAVQLHDEIRLFQKVKAACKRHIIKPLNHDRRTAEELFAASNKELHGKATEWLMRTAENCTILSVFIATVAFAAAYTVPGGPDQNTGIPLLNSKPWFVVFAVADVISLTFALRSVAAFTNILTSSFSLEDFVTYGIERLITGIRNMGLSILMMVVAFAATIVLVMTNTKKVPLWIVLGFLPVVLFLVSYAPLRSLGPQEYPEWMIQYSEHLKSLRLRALEFLWSNFLNFGLMVGKKSNIQASRLSQV